MDPSEGIRPNENRNNLLDDEAFPEVSDYKKTVEQIEQVNKYRDTILTNIQESLNLIENNGLKGTPLSRYVKHVAEYAFDLVKVVSEDLKLQSEGLNPRLTPEYTLRKLEKTANFSAQTLAKVEKATS